MKQDCLLLAISIVLTPLRGNAGEEELRDPRCEGAHGLSSPLPDACLGVIDTDRPHQTDTPHVIPAGHTQFESAVAAVQVGGPLGAAPDRRSPHVVLLEDNYKFGLVSGVDLEFLFKHAEYSMDSWRLLPPGPLQVRAKFAIVEQSGGVPAVTLVPWVFLPVDRFQPFRGGLLVFWEWELPARLELEMNAGMLFGAKPKPTTAIVLASALTYTVAGNLRVFVDVYATGWDVAFGTGALWAFTRDAQIDLGTYVGVNGDEPVATPFLGFSLRR
jgi:hypothetical protein